MKIAIIGDVGLDQYFYGEVTRISPEAPIPILDLLFVEKQLGLAANVAMNLKALGENPILFSVASPDLKRKIEAEELSTDNILIRPNWRIIKNRYIAGGQHLLRVDDEERYPLPLIVEQTLIESLSETMYDIIVVQDYNKGVCTEDVIRTARSRCHNLLIDPYALADDAKYDVKPDYIFPNRKELQTLTSMPVATIPQIKKAALELQKSVRAKNVVVKLSEEGVLFLYDDEFIHLRSQADKIVDVTGAGDTVIATVAAALAKEESSEVAVEMANIAAGIAVGKKGTATIKWADIAFVRSQGD